MENLGLVEPRGIQRHFERGGDVRSLHRGAQLPGDDVAGEVVEDRRQVEPSPADDLEIVKSVCQSWFGAVVLSLNSSAAFITMKTGLAIRSWALRSR